ncbi:efflux RND transporter periplasmic adaptor subunit [Clostridium sp. DJ247]|uniref:efflux RND transporter periplasmic adaptor subunit n=1 Tax=Clostridium sp. DJ247 TaxID=2726188 RepID=UPI00162A01AB|nr:HlyD family efflux transporter periplasmic adaptor subunit [Clostridium sp. DJ247]MBC2580212.1 HlyD family efflux transporter periplasmic adaptor subunit [Clostridium sp. DJ247]
MKFNKSVFKINKRVIIIAVVIIVVIGMVVSSYTKAKNNKAKLVTTSKVSTKKVVQTVSVTGNIEAKYRNTIALNPSQKVVKVLVNEGQQVKKGDILVQLDISDYESQLGKAKITLDGAQSTLKQLMSTGAVADKSNAENSVAQAQALLENSQRNYDDANKKFQQSQSLMNAGAISQNDYDAAKKTLEDVASTLKSSQAALTNSKNILNNINTSSADKITNQRNQVSLVQADIDNLNKKIEDSNIRANTDGIVVKMDAKENQTPGTGDMIIIDDTSLFKISADISQYDAVKISKGQKASIKLKGSDKKYTGTVTDIGQLAQVKSNGTDQEYKVNIKITMDNSDESLKAGYEADADITLSEKDKVLAIGFDSIKEEKANAKKYVYTVSKDNKVSKKYIQTGLETDYDVEVTSGLSEGDRYIANPPETLHEGDKVSDAGGVKK